MSDPGSSITLAPVDPTPAVIGSTRPSTTQSGLDTTMSSLTSIPFVTPTPTLLSTTFFSPLTPTSDFPTQTAIPYPSISAISLSSISVDFPTVIPTSTSVGDQTITTTSVVETGIISTDIPRDTGFVRQTGAIIGITIAATFVLCLIILLIFFACKRHHSNRSYNSSLEDISAVSRDPYWRQPLEDQEYIATYGRSMSPNYPKTPGSHEGGFVGDYISVEGGGSRSVESADGLLMRATFGGQPRIPLVDQTPHCSRSYSSNDGLDASRPWWGNTQPLNINKRNKCYNYQRPPLTVDSHISAGGSTSSSGFGGGSSWHHGPGSSEALLTNTKTSITGPKPIHLLSGRRHYSTPPTAFMLGRDTSLEYGARRIRQHQEEKEQQDRADKGISQVILARLRASRRPSTATTVKAYSQSTTIRSEESSSSSAPSYIYSPSLLNPPIRMPQTVPRIHLPCDNTLHEYPHHRNGVGDTSKGLLWPGVTLPPAPSPTLTDASSMIEGLLHPRLRTVLAQPYQLSTTSLRDHEDYTRPINGLVNNHIRSTTTFETQDAGDLGETRA